MSICICRFILALRQVTTEATDSVTVPSSVQRRTWLGELPRSRFIADFGAPLALEEDVETNDQDRVHRGESTEMLSSDAALHLLGSSLCAEHNDVDG